MDWLHWHFNQDNTFSIFISFHAGSVYESKDLRGIAHLLEHMKFKNTCCPCASPSGGASTKDSADITKMLEDIGAVYNAFTSKDQTTYYIHSIAENAQKACDIACDIAFHMNVTPKLLDTERKVVLEEVAGTKDNAMFELLNMADEAVLGPRNPYSRTPAGFKKHIHKMTVSDLNAFHKQYYTHNASVLVNCPRALKDSLERIIRRHYSPIETPSKATVEHVDATEYSVTVTPAPTSQYTTIMTFRAFPRTDPRSHYLDFWSYILTYGVHSLLGRVLRNRKGLVYSVNTMHQPFHYLGLFHVLFASSNKDTTMLIRTVLDIFTSIRAQFTPSAFKKAKKSYLHYMVYSQRSTNTFCEYLATECFHNPAFSFPQLLEKIKAVSYAEMVQIADEVFDKKRMGVVSLGAYGSPYEVNDNIVELILDTKK